MRWKLALIGSVTGGKYPLSLETFGLRNTFIPMVQYGYAQPYLRLWS